MNDVAFRDGGRQAVLVALPTRFMGGTRCNIISLLNDFCALLCYSFVLTPTSVRTLLAIFAASFGQSDTSIC